LFIPDSVDIQEKMRILFLTNFYPPHSLGGLEQSCQQVAEGLRQRGHQIEILTSRHASHNGSAGQDGVYRSLYLEMDMGAWSHNLIFFTRRKAREKANLEIFDRHIRKFDPDIIFIWGMWNLPRSLPLLAEAARPGKVIYRFAEYWPTLPSQHELFWQRPGRSRLSRLVKALPLKIARWEMAREIQPPSPKFEHVICVSEATCKTLSGAGVVFPDMRIIRTGIEIDQYSTAVRGSIPGNGSRVVHLLFAGRLAEDKGADTAIKAMQVLVHEKSYRNIHLNIAGTGRKYYEENLHQLVAQSGLADWVSFLGQVPYSDMPAIFQENDILLVPSKWPEPFARILLEGMASGMVVIASEVGGTGELILDGENGLLFPPGDHNMLAACVAALLNNPAYASRLAGSGQQTVKQKFPYSKMIDETEQYLLEVSALPEAGIPGVYLAGERVAL